MSPEGWNIIIVLLYKGIFVFFITNLLFFSVYKTKKVLKASWDDAPQVMSEAV